MLFSITACGDDGGGTDACVGHTCTPGGAQLSDPEGGHVILEYIYFDTEMQATIPITPTAARIIAFFMNSQTPESNPFPTPGVCNNLVATRGWPATIGTPHVDLDVGAVTVTGKNGAGADVTIPVDKKPMGRDQFQRPHDIFYQTILPNAADLLKPDSAYTVNIGGAGTIPATSLTDALFLAQDFQISSPGLEDNGPLVAGTDFTVKWTPATSANLPAGDEVLGVTWLVDVTGGVTHMCPTLHGAGTMTIPGSAITEYKAIAQSRGLPTNKMIMLRNAIVHKLSRLPNGEPENQRRIDMLSVMCWLQLMDVQ